MNFGSGISVLLYIEFVVVEGNMFFEPSVNLLGELMVLNLEPLYYIEGSVYSLLNVCLNCDLEEKFEN